VTKATPSWEISNCSSRKGVVGGLVFSCHEVTCLDCFFVGFEKLTDLLVVGFLDLKFFFPGFFFEVGLQAAMAAALKPRNLSSMETSL
jgi:hypothetical protein